MLYLLSLIFSASSALAALGPIATDKPAPAGGSVANDAPPLASFYTGHSPPYPTDDWWVGYGAGSGDAYESSCSLIMKLLTNTSYSVVAGPFPYESSLAAGAIEFGMSSSRQFDGTSIKQPTQTDWSVGFVEHSGNVADHKALTWVSISLSPRNLALSSILNALCTRTRKPCKCSILRVQVP